MDQRMFCKVSVAGVVSDDQDWQVIVVMSLLAAEKEKDSDEQARVMKTAAVAASNALAEFAGLRRRFDWIGTVQGCHIIDDYAHHPTEVRAVLQAARQRFDQQPIWVIFQPHTVR